jgi:hypothetical protein
LKDFILSEMVSERVSIPILFLSFVFWLTLDCGGREISGAEKRGGKFFILWAQKKEGVFYVYSTRHKSGAFFSQKKGKHHTTELFSRDAQHPTCDERCTCLLVSEGVLDIPF